MIINDGTLVFTTNEPGEHRLIFKLFPFLDTETTINAI